MSSLSDIAIRQAKARDKPYKLADGQGLYLLVQKSGARLWRYKYRIGGVENVFAIGQYPNIGLQEARQLLAAARRNVAAGIHPVAERRKALAKRMVENSNTFRVIAEEWVKRTRTAKKWSDKYAAAVDRAMHEWLFPRFGQLPIADVDAQMVLTLLQDIAANSGPTVALNVRAWCSAIFCYAVVTQRLAVDPAAALKGVIIRPRPKHARALTPAELGSLIVRTRFYSGRMVAIAVEMLAYTFVRTVELRRAEWSEIDLEGALWIIPEEKMKKRRRHAVPLSRQVISLLREIHDWTGDRKFVFPNQAGLKKMMPAMAVNKAIEGMGYAVGEITGHDFRATASTMLHEAGFRGEVVDMQMAHLERSQTKRTYNHAEFLDERRAMMQVWADKVDACAKKAQTSTVIKPGRVV